MNNEYGLLNNFITSMEKVLKLFELNTVRTFIIVYIILKSWKKIWTIEYNQKDYAYVMNTSRIYLFLILSNTKYNEIYFVASDIHIQGRSSLNMSSSSVNSNNLASILSYSSFALSKFHFIGVEIRKQVLKSFMWSIEFFEFYGCETWTVVTEENRL